MKSNLDKLRQMLNTEVNTAMFNPDVRDHTPERVIIIIENSDGHVHCICPNVEDTQRMFKTLGYVKGDRIDKQGN